MPNKHIIISILSLAVALKAGAQQRGTDKDTTINGATIEIIQSYKPEVKQAPKPELTPSLPPVDTAYLTFRYTVPQQTLYYTYSSLPLRPLALSIDTPGRAMPNYVKLGGGNLSTLYLDAGIGGLKGRNYESAIHLHHLSQSGDIKYQKVSLSNLDAEATLHKNSHAWHATLGILHNQYGFYGYDHAVYNYNASAVKQAFTGVSLGIDMKNELYSYVHNLDYHPAIKVSTYSDKFNASETSFNINLPFTYYIDSNLQLYLAGNFAITQFKNPLTSQSNNIFQAAPGIRFRTGIFKGHAGISPTSGNGGNLYFLPDVEVQFSIPGSQFKFNAGWQGTLVQNTFKDLSTINPYMLNLYTVQQTKTNEVFAGIKSNIGDNMTFNARASWWQYEGLPVFINDTTSDNKQFQVINDAKTNALSLQAAIRYQVARTVSIGVSGQWTNYYQTSTLAKVYHRPGVRFGADIMAQPIKKLVITSYVSFLDKLYALDKGNRTLKLNAILDLGAGAEYTIIDRLNVFLQANNLLNNKYQRWYGYDAFGINLYGGVRVKF